MILLVMFFPIAIGFCKPQRWQSHGESGGCSDLQLFSRHRIEFIFSALKSQRALLPKFVTGKLEFSENTSSIRHLSIEKRSVFPEVIYLIKITLIAPATNAISTLMRAETSMTESRLNG